MFLHTFSTQVTRDFDYNEGFMQPCLDCEKLEIRFNDEIERLRTELYITQKWLDNYRLAFEKSQGKDLNDG